MRFGKGGLTVLETGNPSEPSLGRQSPAKQREPQQGRFCHPLRPRVTFAFPIPSAANAVNLIAMKMDRKTATDEAAQPISCIYAKIVLRPLPWIPYFRPRP